MWYCAHAIFYFELKHEKQDSYLVHENVYLIQADNEKVAMQKAMAIAEENEDLSEDNHLEVNEKPARYIFAGIRKLITVSNYDKRNRSIIESGVEVTYSEFEVDDVSGIQALKKGDFVEVLYRE
jgi:hypothetical protein